MVVSCHSQYYGYTNSLILSPDSYTNVRTHTHTVTTACILKMAAWHVYEIAAAAAAEQQQSPVANANDTQICVGVCMTNDITMCIVSTTIEFYELHFSLELVVLLSICVRSTVLRFFFVRLTKLEQAKKKIFLI